MDIALVSLTCVYMCSHLFIASVGVPLYAPGVHVLCVCMYELYVHTYNVMCLYDLCLHYVQLGVQCIRVYK